MADSWRHHAATYHVRVNRQECVTTIVDWYAHHARDLPWRGASVTAWGVLVSEFMLQQTPVARVVEPWTSWLERWPTPAALAAEPQSAAIRAWGRLGYPRRAMRLHQAATIIAREHGNVVPADVSVLMTLPGVGRYTAAAVAAFAYHQRVVVLDTNVRRVLARAEGGVAVPPAHLNGSETQRAESWLPDAADQAARWAAASMELGAQICTARNPDCPRCPSSTRAAGWRPAVPSLALIRVGASPTSALIASAGVACWRYCVSVIGPT